MVANAHMLGGEAGQRRAWVGYERERLCRLLAGRREYARTVAFMRML